MGRPFSSLFNIFIFIFISALIYIQSNQKLRFKVFYLTLNTLTASFNYKCTNFF